MSFRPFVTLFLGLLSVSLPGQQIPGQLPFRHYPAETYQGNPFVFSLAMDTSRQLFVANYLNPGLLVFDGATWKKEYVEDNIVWDLEPGPDQKLYLSSTDELGYLAVNEYGENRYTSLVSGFWAQDSTLQIGQLRDVIAHDNRLFFRGRNCLLAYDPDAETYQSWQDWTGQGFIRVFSSPMGFYLLGGGDGVHKTRLYRLEKDTFIQLQEPFFHDLRNELVRFIALPGNSLLAVTKSNGLFRFDGTSFTPLLPPTHPLIGETISHAVPVSRNRIALASRENGIYIVDWEGTILHHLDQEQGLPSSFILHLFYDPAADHLWAGTYDAGIIQVDVSGQFTTFDQDLTGEGFYFSNIARRQNDMYGVSATGAGFRMLKSGMPGFQPLSAPAEGQARALICNEDFCLAGIDNVLVELRDGIATRISDLQGWPIGYIRQSLRYPDFFFIATDAGLQTAYLEKGRWITPIVEAPFLPEVELNSVVERRANEVWVSEVRGDYYRLTFPDSFPLLRPEIKRYPADDSLLIAGNKLIIVDGQLVAGSNRYNPQTDQFEKDPRFQRPYDPDVLKWFLQAPDSLGDVWALISLDSGEKLLGAYRLQPDGQYVWDPTPLQGVFTSQLEMVEQVFPDRDGILWLAGQQVIRIDTKHSLAERNFTPRTRRVFLDNDSLLYQGNGAAPAPDIPFSENRIRFQFAAPDFPIDGQTIYRTRLQPFDREWSGWSDNTERNYTNLPEGNYRFQVQARTPDGQLSKIGIYTFRILPPWYRTWWSYAGYGLIVLFLGYLFYQWLKKRFEQQAAQQLALQEAMQIKEMEELKSRLYTNITHEFRTPLTIIMGINDTIKGHEEEKKLIGRNSRNLLRLINQLLDLSKLDAGSLRLTLFQADIIPFLNYLTDSFQSIAQEKNIALRFSASIPELIMDFDEEKVQHIIYNLLSNAIKFTPEGGRIDLRAEQVIAEGVPSLHIEVADTGMGIDRQHLPHIFDRFFQADNTMTRRYEGAGIGLALTRDLVELMEGHIHVESTPGEGTVFRIRIPITRNAPKENPQLPDLVTLALETTAPSPDRAAATDPAADRPNLLIIEDNADVLSYLHRLLQDSHQLETAMNGREGLEKATEQLPDIIICDVMLPEMNGYEVCRTLKSDERTSHIPIILLTGLASDKDRLEGLSSGADAFLTKPFNKEELFIRLEQLVSLRQKLQARYGDTQLLAPGKAIPSDSLESQFLKKLKEVIESHLDDPDFQVPQLAEHMLMSQIQVYRKLKALTDKTPVQFIRTLRLNHALERIKSTSQTISEIAYSVGFSDPSYFTRAFQKEFGQAPSAYRK